MRDDFWCLLNTNSRENREMALETTRMISDEFTNQVTRRLYEIKSSLNTQIHDAITTAIAAKVLPFIRYTLDAQERANFTVMN